MAQAARPSVANQTAGCEAMAGRSNSVRVSPGSAFSSAVASRAAARRPRSSQAPVYQRFTLIRARPRRYQGRVLLKVHEARLRWRLRRPNESPRLRPLLVADGVEE